MRIIERNPITVYKFEELKDMGATIDMLDVSRQLLVLNVKCLDTLAEKIVETFGKDTYIYRAATIYQAHKDTGVDDIGTFTGVDKDEAMMADGYTVDPATGRYYICK